MLMRLNLPAPGAACATALSALRGGTAALVLLGGVCLTAAAAPAAAPGGDTWTPAQVAESLRRLRGEGSAPGRSRASALDVLLDHREYPGRCATPLLLALGQRRSSLGPMGTALLRRLGPLPGAFESAYPPAQESFSGSFRLVFSMRRGDPAALSPDDGDLDGVPDEARDLLERLDQARREVVAAFESSGTPTWRPEADEGVHRVEISDLPGGLGGYVWSQDGETLLVLDKGRIDSAEGDTILRHQIAHLIQVGLTTDESPWWYEAHAVWVEDLHGLHAGERAAAVEAYLESSPGGLEPQAIAAWEGAFLWPHFLTLSGGRPAVLGAAWEEMAALPGNNTVQAMRRAVGTFLGTSLEEQVRAFRIWNLLLGWLDDGNHYPFASLLERPEGAGIRDLPLAWEAPGPVAPLGGRVLHLAAGTSPGGWLLDFEGALPAGWDVTLVTIPAFLERRPALAVLPLEEGRGGTAVPWDEMAGILVVVQNLGDPREEPAEFSLNASYDPLVPFDLMSLSATDEGGGMVALRWQTERELSMLGWRLYRSQDPLSGFEPVHSLMVPAVGGPESTSYIVFDQGLRPGRKYYYMLEGITQQGFRQVTYPVSVRVRPAP